MFLLRKLINYNKKTKYTIYTIVIASFLILMFSKPNEDSDVSKTDPDNGDNPNPYYNTVNNTNPSDKKDKDNDNDEDKDNKKENDDDKDDKDKENDDDKPYVNGGLTRKEAKSLDLPDNIATLISDVLKIVNEERKKAGLKPVTTNVELTKCATDRSKELVSLFSHTRPDGTSCFTILDQNKVPHGACGENISAGYPTAESVMEGWMNSEGHRANILNPSFTKLGVGLYKTDHPNGYHWTQIFTN